MPAVGEKEEIITGRNIAVPGKFQQLEKMKNGLISAVIIDEDSSDSVIFNTQIIALSITARLQNLAKMLRGIIAENKEMSELLDEMVSTEETAELVPSKKIVRSDVKEAAEAAVANAIKEIKGIAQTVISEMERYEFATSRYYVLLAGKYALLLFELKRASAMLGMKQVEIDALCTEYKEYYKLHNIIKSAVLGDLEAHLPGWVKNLRRKSGMASTVSAYEDFVNSLELFIASNTKTIERFGELIKLQSDLRFKKSVEIADALLNAAREYA